MKSILLCTALCFNVILLQCKEPKTLLELRSSQLGITSFKIANNGQLLLSSSSDGTVKVWDLINRKEKCSFNKHRGFVETLDVNNVNNIVASGGEDESIYIWEYYSCTLLFRIPNAHTKSLKALAFSPDGKLLASGSWTNRIKIWDAKTGNHRATLVAYNGGIEDLVFSKDSRVLLSANSNNSVVYWDMTTFKKIDQIIASRAVGVNSILLSDDGTKIITGNGDKTVKIWDFKSKRLLKELEGHKSQVVSLALRSDAKLLASGGVDMQIIIWDLNSGAIFHKIRNEDINVSAIVFIPETSILIGDYKDKIVLQDLTPILKQ